MSDNGDNGSFFSRSSYARPFRRYNPMAAQRPDPSSFTSSGKPIYTLAQADILTIEWRCDCCTAVHKVQKRSLNSTMVKQLSAIYRYFMHPDIYSNLQFHKDDARGHWLHISNYLTEIIRIDREAAKLRYWELIEEHPEEKEDGNPHNGYFRITEFGKKFCRSEVKTFPRVLTQNQRVGFIGFIDEPWVGIVEAGGKKFDYSKEIR